MEGRPIVVAKSTGIAPRGARTPRGQSPSEGPLLRATVCLLLVVVCLPSAGCKSSGRKDGIPPAPPLSATGGGTAAARNDAPTTQAGADGLLAGQILDGFGHHPDDV